MNEAWIIAFVEEHTSLLLIASRARHTLLVYIVSKAKACHSTKQNQCKAEAVSSLTQSMYGHQPVDGGATQSNGDVTPCLPLQPLGSCLLLHS